MSSYNTGRETKPLGAAPKVQNLLKARYALSAWQIILRPTWWPSVGFYLCISLAKPRIEAEARAKARAWAGVGASIEIGV